MAREILFRGERADNGEWVDRRIVGSIHDNPELLEGEQDG